MILNRISQKWKVRSETLAPYKISEYHIEVFVKSEKSLFQEIYWNYLYYLPWEDNYFADAVAKVGSIDQYP